MSTDYDAYVDGETRLGTDSRRRLEMDIAIVPGKAYVEDDCSVHYVSDRLTEDQFVEIAARILGPAFYFTDDEAALAEKFRAEMRRQGYTYAFDR